MRIMLVLTAALALVLAPSAAAKGPFQICGSSGCTLLGEEAKPPVRIFGDGNLTPALAPPTPAPYFIIRFANIADTLAYWIPSASVFRFVPQNGTGSWVATLPSEEALLRDKTAAMKPYAAPTRASVYVDYEPAKRATGYLRLYTLGTPVTVAPVKTSWLEVWIRGGHSPWNDGMALFWISRKGNLLKREDGTVLTISPDVARRIRAGLPLG